MRLHLRQSETRILESPTPTLAWKLHQNESNVGLKVLKDA